MKRFPPKKILVPTDLSEPSNAALAFARRFMEKLGSAITVVPNKDVEEKGK